MKLYSQNENYKLYQGSMLDMLDVIPEGSVDSIITDPPYELNFMGKGWDNAGVSFQPDTWRKCYEVLKPGGYLLAFGGSRTFHRIACAIEDAGFEIRDTIMWLYGSGFPKSMNIGLAIDKKNGVDNRTGIIKTDGKATDSNSGCYNMNNGNSTMKKEYEERIAQNEWEGWGTALKPSFEPIIVARKPFKGSLVDNVIENGVGGINIDECRVGNETIKGGTMPKMNSQSDGINLYNFGKKDAERLERPDSIGRFPANTILTYDETDFDEVCGGFPYTKGEIGRAGRKSAGNYEASSYKVGVVTDYGLKDSGSASRYFMNCKYTGKDEEIWKQLLVSNVENNLEILKATKDNIAQMNVEDLLKELKDHYAKYVENKQDLIETSIVQDIVKILTWDFKIETSQVIQDFILNYKECIQFLNLVQFVEKMDNIDTTQTTQNLLKLFGYVKVVITNYIVGNFTVNELDQKRYTYQPKASKKDRDEGLDEFEEKYMAFSNQAKAELKRGNVEFKGNEDNPMNFVNSVSVRKNTHPTVKPTELMQYLIRLVTPNGATILDPFNGSGSTGKAVMYENYEKNKNYKYIGIELTEEYLPISKARIEYVCNLKEKELKDMQMSIFDFKGSDKE